MMCSIFETPNVKSVLCLNSRGHRTNTLDYTALTAYFYVTSDSTNKRIPKNKFQNILHVIRNKMLPAHHSKRFWYRSLLVVVHTQATKSQGLNIQILLAAATKEMRKNSKFSIIWSKMAEEIIKRKIIYLIHDISVIIFCITNI